MSFSGFKPEAIKFLFENRMHNDKEWYEKHKPDYKKYVYNPFVELITEIAPSMLNIDEQVITVPSKIISRVRRDTRFTHDKTLYRDNAWFVFLRDKSQMSVSPCFWFDIGQQGSSYGVGYYGASTKSMAILRDMIIANDPVFLKAFECYKNQSVFKIGGEMYKRSKFPEQPEELKQWLDRKNIYFESVQNNFELAFSPQLPEVLKNGFSALKPIYDLFCIVQARTL